MKVRISATIDEDVAEHVNDVCNYYTHKLGVRLSRSSLIESALKDWLSNKKKKGLKCKK